jgi:hypothetical protein
MDGSKSMSKTMENDEFDPCVGFCVAVTNHLFESKSKRNKIVEEGMRQYLGRKKNKDKK